MNIPSFEKTTVIDGTMCLSLFWDCKGKYKLQIKGLILIVENDVFRTFTLENIIVSSFSCFFEMNINLAKILVRLLPAFRPKDFFLKELRNISLKYKHQRR